MTIAVDFADTKQLIIDKLIEVVTSAQQVDPYVGDIVEALEGKRGEYPRLVVSYAGTTPTQIDGPNYSEDNHYEVGVFVQSHKGGNDLNVEAEAMLRAVKNCLINVVLAENLEPAIPGEIRQLWGDSTVQVWVVPISIKMDMEYQWPEV